MKNQNNKRATFESNQICSQKISHKQKGFTLVELGLVLALGSLLTAGGIAMYKSTQLSQNTDQLTKDIIAIGSGIEASGAATGTYGTASLDEYLVRSGKVPKTVTITGTAPNRVLNHKFDSTIQTMGLTNHYYVLAAGIPGDACMSLFQSGVSWNRISVGTAPTAANVTTIGDNAPYTQAKAAAACGLEDSQNDIYFIK